MIFGVTGVPGDEVSQCSHYKADYQLGVFTGELFV
jgi:hypothetical protein